MSTSEHRTRYSCGITGNTVTLNRHSIWETTDMSAVFAAGFRSLSVGILLFFFAAVSLLAQGEELPPPDTTILPTDSLTAADSLALADTVQPQLRVGLFTGGVFTTASVANIDLDPKTRIGFHGGLRAEMEFAYPIYFLVEVEYAEKGVRSSYRLASGTTVEEDFHFNYLDIPILYRIGIPVGEKYSLSAGFGVHIGLLLSRNKVVRVAEIDSASRIEKGLESFDFGLEGRLGTEYALSPKLSLTADLRYLHGLQNILILASKDDDRLWKGRSLFVSAGIMYQLQRSIRK